MFSGGKTHGSGGFSGMYTGRAYPAETLGASGVSKGKPSLVGAYLIAAFTANWNLMASKSSVVLTPLVVYMYFVCI